MKKYLSLLIALLLIFANVPSFADELAAEKNYAEYKDEVDYSSYIVVNGEIVASSNISEEKYWSEDYPLAPVMKALGYEVLFDGEKKIITCVKPDISYGFDIDKCLVWSIIDGEMSDIVLYSNPYIENGVTYVPSFFFSYILEEPGSFVYNYTGDGNNSAYVFYDLSQETARINTALKDYMDKFLAMGIKPQEYGVKCNVDFKLICEDLGLTINGGTEMTANCYVDLNNEFISCNLEYDFSGLYNILKLIMHNTIDTDEKFSMQTVIDKDTVMTKNNFTPYAPESGWVTSELPNGLNFEISEKMLGQVLEAYGADAVNINKYAGAVADCFEALMKCINISKEGDTVTVTSSVDENFIKSIIDIAVYNVSGEGSEVSKSILEGTKLKLDSISVIKDGIYTKADETGDGVICVTIPNTGVSFTIEFNINSTLADSDLPIYHSSSEIPEINE